MTLIPRGSSEELELEWAKHYIKRGEFDQAAPILRKLESRYVDSRVLGRLGHVEYELGNVGEAARQLAKASQLDPTCEIWSVLFFHALWDLGRRTEAFDGNPPLSPHPA